MPNHKQSKLDRLWGRISRPMVVSGLFLAVGIAMLLPIVAGPVAPSFERFIAVLAVGGAAAAALVVAHGGPAVIRWARRVGLLRTRAVPWFKAELAAAPQMLGWPRAHRGALALWILLAGGLVTGACLAISIPGGWTGELQMVPGVDYEATAPTDDFPVARNLDLRLRLLQMSATEGSVTLHASHLPSESDADVVLNAGERRRVRGMYFALSGFFALPGVGAVTLEVTSRETGDSEQVTILVGGSTELEVSDVSLMVLRDDADLGGLGSAVFIEERYPDRRARSEWIFIERPGFDERHGSGTVSIDVVQVHPRTVAVVRVRQTDGRIMAQVWCAIFAVWTLLSVFVFRPRSWFEGKDGDYVAVGFGLPLAVAEHTAQLAAVSAVGDVEPLLAVWKQTREDA